MTPSNRRQGWGKLVKGGTRSGFETCSLNCQFIWHGGMRYRDLIAKPFLMMAKSNLLALKTGAG